MNPNQPLQPPVRIVKKRSSQIVVPPSKWKSMPLGAYAAKLGALMPRRKEWKGRRVLVKTIVQAFDRLYGEGTAEWARAWLEWAEWASPPEDKQKYSRIDSLPNNALFLIAVGLIDRHIIQAQRPEPWPDRAKYISRKREPTCFASPALPGEYGKAPASSSSSPLPRKSSG